MRLLALLPLASMLVASAAPAFAEAPAAVAVPLAVEAFSPAADFSYDYQDLLFKPIREK